MLNNGRKVDLEELQRKMDQVEVKAQQTNYLLNPLAGKINPSGANIPISNLNESRRTPVNIPLEEAKGLLQTSSQKTNDNRPGFNIDLRMFSEHLRIVLANLMISKKILGCSKNILGFP